MISAAGRPTWSSPLFRSCCESSSKSLSRTLSPVIATSKPERPFSRSTTSFTGAMSPVSSTRIGMIVACRSADTSEGSCVL